MAKRTTPPLAYSEYVSLDSDNSVQVWQARLRVIEAAKRVYPKFLEKLATDVFPLYCQLAKEGKLAKGRNDFDKALWGKFPYDALTDDGGLKLALSKWADHFNAEAEWLKVGALRTLRGWYVTPEWRESLKWDPQYGHRDRPVVGKKFKFCYPRWEVQLLSWQAYSKSLRQSSDALINKGVTGTGLLYPLDLLLGMQPISGRYQAVEWSGSEAVGSQPSLHLIRWSSSVCDTAPIWLRTGSRPFGKYRWAAHSRSVRRPRASYFFTGVKPILPIPA
jgi:hypothetical protein